MVKRTRSKALLVTESHREVTLDTLAECAEVHPEYLRTLVEFGLVEPIRSSESEMVFRASAILRVRRIIRIKRDLGVNLPGVAVILRLTEELREVRRELDELRSRL